MALIAVHSSLVDVIGIGSLGYLWSFIHYFELDEKNTVFNVVTLNNIFNVIEPKTQKLYYWH